MATLSNNDLILSLSNLLKTNKGFFKSEKQAAFILSQVCENKIVNHFTTYKNIARDHYFLDSKGVYKIERYTTKKGYVTTWARGQVHSLESAKNLTDSIKLQIEKNQLDAFGYAIDSRDFYAFIELFDSYNTPKNLLSAIESVGIDNIEWFFKQIKAYELLVNDFKNKYDTCHP